MPDSAPGDTFQSTQPVKVRPSIKSGADPDRRRRTTRHLHDAHRRPTGKFGWRRDGPPWPSAGDAGDRRL